jgi:putative CocE/NonD family hydrolase
MSELSDISDPQRVGVRMQWGVKIPLRDGVHLNATLYLPNGPTTPSPSIFTLTPYVGQTSHDQGVYFAAHGYPFLTVDVRGRGNSEGDFRPLIQEASDGYDVVEWLAQQPYCNGQVTMWGGSYTGYDQWVTAKECPPHLATIVPTASAYLGVDFPIRNNISSPYLMQWLTLVSGRTLQDRIFWNNERFWRGRYRQWLESGTPFKTLDTFLGNPSPIFQEWIAHPQQDAYWDRYNPTANDYSRICLLILTITGIYDSDQPGALRHYREHLKHSSAEIRARHYLVIGPWDHAGTRAPQAEFCGIKVGPAGLLDLGKLHLEWYAWTMQGGAKPEFLQKNVAYYVMGADKWRYADTLETITAEHRRFYLDSAGSASRVFASGILGNEAGTGDADRYVYDPRDTGTAEVEAASTDPLSLRPTFPTDNVRDQTLVFANEGKQLLYHSAPFESDAEISGFFKLTAWIAIDQPDTDFRATAYEIGLDGSSILLTTDCIRARYREGLREPKLIHTADPLRYDFECFTFVSRQIGKGSRLRLVIGPINSIYFEKNYNSGGIVSEETMNDARSVTVRLFHDESHPSALYVPLGQAELGGP